MDNSRQIDDIIKFYDHLCHVNTDSTITLDDAAMIWGKRYARAWRKLHGSSKRSSTQSA